MILNSVETMTMPQEDATDHPGLGWAPERLKDICVKIGSGLTPTGGAVAYVETGIPLLRSQNIHFDGLHLDDVAYITEETHAEMSGSRVQQHDVLLNVTGASIGRCTFAPEDLGEANVNQHVCIIRPSTQVHHTFLAYFLGSPWGQDQILSGFTGASRQGLGQRCLGEIRIPLPDIDEQKRIAAFLKASCAVLDTAIATKRKQVDTLGTLRKTAITRALTCGLDPAVPTQLSDQHWIGEIPIHWSTPCLKRLISEPLTYGLNEAAELDDPALPRYLRITDFDDSGALRNDTFRSLPIDIAKQAMLRPNDILFARSGATVGKTFIFSEYAGEACFAGYLIRARTISWKLHPRFLYHFTKTTTYENWKNLVFTQATIQNISAAKYNYLSIPLPPLREQQEICAFVEIKDREFKTLSEKIESQISTLTAYRKSLIHECVTGQRRITEADLGRVASAGDPTAADSRDGETAA